MRHGKKSTNSCLSRFICFSVPMSEAEIRDASAGLFGVRIFSVLGFGTFLPSWMLMNGTLEHQILRAIHPPNHPTFIYLLAS